MFNKERVDAISLYKELSKIFDCQLHKAHSQIFGCEVVSGDDVEIFTIVVNFLPGFHITITPNSRKIGGTLLQVRNRKWISYSYSPGELCIELVQGTTMPYAELINFEPVIQHCQINKIEYQYFHTLYLTACQLSVITKSGKWLMISPDTLYYDKLPSYNVPGYCHDSDGKLCKGYSSKSRIFLDELLEFISS